MYLICKKWIYSFLFSCLIALTSVSCASVDNNDRSLQELVNHVVSRTGGVYAGKVFVPPVKALDGVAIKVEGREVFFYKYDITRTKQLRKLKQIRESNKLYINGIPFAALVNGSFVMIEHETNIKKEELTAAFRSF
ncbi:MAG: hypothetical protein J6S58_02730 [Lentisphaeria bacterium]|nr:hypothetical protein [Lentisphaeria bacterium]